MQKQQHAAEKLPTNVRLASNVIAKLVDVSGSRIVTIDYVSADGTVKTINGRLGVRKHVKGTGKTADSAKYLTVYKMQAASVTGGGSQHYRTIRRDSVVAVRGLSLQCKKD